MTTNVYPRTLGWYAVLMATRILVGVIVACIFLPNSGRGRTLGQSEEKHGGAVLDLVLGAEVEPTQVGVMAALATYWR